MITCDGCAPSTASRLGFTPFLDEQHFLSPAGVIHVRDSAGDSYVWPIDPLLKFQAQVARVSCALRRLEGK